MASDAIVVSSSLAGCTRNGQIFIICPFFYRIPFYTPPLKKEYG